MCVFLLQKWSPSLDLVHEWRAHEWPVYCLAADGNSIFSSSSDGEVKEWDAKSGEFKQMTIMLVNFYGV